MTKSRKSAEESNGPTRPSLIASGERSIAIDTQGGPFLGVASSGDHTTIVHVPPHELRPPASVDAPPGVVRLPALHASFVGRARELALLDETLTGSGAAVVQAVHGLGGVGKSTLAAHWAGARREVDNPIWWITADSSGALAAGLAALAAALQPALARLPQDQLKERALQWLATHDGWLLILDNVTEPEDVQPLLAHADKGRILITSRRASGWHDTAVPIHLDTLAPDEAHTLLTRILTGDATRAAADLDGAAELCAEVGYLPLAIEQVGAYIVQTGITPRAYLRLLAEDPAYMYRRAKEGYDSERTIARIWAITLDRLTDTPLAGHLLRVLAWYAPDAIPRALVGPLGSEPAVVDAVGRLAAYSMISATEDSLDVHRLVQAVTRASDPDDPHRRPHDIVRAREAAVACLNDALPTAVDAPDRFSAWRRLIPHIDALAQHADPDSDTALTAYVFCRAGAFLQHQSLNPLATPHLERAGRGFTRHLGARHPNTLTARHHLARAYQDTGELSRAIQLYGHLLHDYEQVRGPGHAETLILRRSLAQALATAGDVGSAIPMLERVLDAQESLLEADHPDALTTRHTLADAYGQIGDLRKAVSQYERVLTVSEEVLGPDHPDTLATRANLAGAHVSTDPDKSIELYERLLNDQERVLGSEHPGTLTTLSSLSRACVVKGELQRAIALCERSLRAREKSLGPGHPDTLLSRSSLGLALSMAGDMAKALPLLQQVLDDCLESLGADHPDTLTARSKLAEGHARAGNAAHAVRTHLHCLRETERVLGTDHPDTATARHNLAVAYTMAGNTARAVPLFEQTLTDRIRILGADHPQTNSVRVTLAKTHASARNHQRALLLFEQAWREAERVLGTEDPGTLSRLRDLATAHLQAGQPTLSIPLYERALKDSTRLLGDDHVQTLGIRSNLATAHQSAGNTREALDGHRHSAAECRRVLGPDHPDTLGALNNLANAHARAGDRSRAIESYERLLTDCRRVFGTDDQRTDLVAANLAALRGHGPTRTDDRP
ncbi:tetratricopeptide repeat protein [Streptomyces iakyrus]|uniref:tetratricopeptide repeat protein n=1 Tax=Streptomyces iakyrus TaxID=68219 RepID=UPI00380CA27C